MRLLSSLKSDIVCTVLFFLGMINVGNAHRDDCCHPNTPMSHSCLISFIRTALCLCGIGYGLPWYCFIPPFHSKDTGSSFQSPSTQSKSGSNLSSTESSFSLSEAVRWEQFSLLMAGRSAFSYLASKISTMRLVLLRVLIGSWAKQEFSLSVLVILGLSCRLAIFLMGKRISSIVIVFSWKSNFTPRSCIVCLPIMRSYIGTWSPRLYSTMSGWSQTFLLAKYSTKEISMSPTLSVMKMPLEVPHNWETTHFTREMHLLEP